MNTADIVAYLQSQFAGQLVLYVPDMAKILGKSDKAVAGLISRNALPFRVKLLGGLRCVDIFQVAQWLASTPAAAEEVTQPAPSVKTTSKRKPSRKPIEAGSASVPLPDSMTPLVQKLLSMRHDYAEAIERYAGGLMGDERAFLHGVAEEMRGRGARYRVTVSVGSSTAPDESAFWEQALGHYGLLDAEVDLLQRLTDARYAPPELPTTYTLWDGQHTVFRCVVSCLDFAIEVNELQLYLPGL